MRACLLFIVLFSFLPAGVPGQSAGQTPTTAPLSIHDALGQMAEIETLIDTARLENRRRLLEADRQRLRAGELEDQLRRGGQRSEESRRLFEQLGKEAENDIESIDAELRRRERELAESRRAIRLAAAGLAGASADRLTPPADLAGLALLQQYHREQAGVASLRILRLQSRRAELTGSREETAEAAREYSVFSQFGLEDLRARHRQLARRVEELRSQANLDARRAEELLTQRAQLNALVARLSASQIGELTRHNEPTTVTPDQGLNVPAPQTGPFQPPPTPAPIEAPEKHIAKADVGARSAMPEIPYEKGSSPAVSAVEPTEPDERNEIEGARHVFWRSRPVGVRTLIDGKVAFAGPVAGYRHVLILDHGGGWHTLFGNLTQSRLKAGETVVAGTMLGEYRAEEGIRAEPMWFEVRQKSQPVRAESWPALPADWTERLFVTE